MRVYYEELASLAGFNFLAPCSPIRPARRSYHVNYPTEAAKMREWEELARWENQWDVLPLGGRSRVRAITVAPSPRSSRSGGHGVDAAPVTERAV